MKRHWLVVVIMSAVLTLMLPITVWASWHLAGDVTYSGAKTGTVKVVALKDASPVETAEITVTGPGTYPYDIGLGTTDINRACAFMDLAGDGWPPEADEPHGCHPNPFVFSGYLYDIDIVLEDPAPEFVPEPGSILLLGSGLAGLAGYATLRWRARE